MRQQLLLLHVQAQIARAAQRAVKGFPPSTPGQIPGKHRRSVCQPKQNLADVPEQAESLKDMAP